MEWNNKPNEVSLTQVRRSNLLPTRPGTKPPPCHPHTKNHLYHAIQLVYGERISEGGRERGSMDVWILEGRQRKMVWMEPLDAIPGKCHPGVHISSATNACSKPLHHRLCRDLQEQQSASLCLLGAQRERGCWFVNDLSASAELLSSVL